MHIGSTYAVCVSSHETELSTLTSTQYVQSPYWCVPLIKKKNIQRYVFRGSRLPRGQRQLRVVPTVVRVVLVINNLYAFHETNLKTENQQDQKPGKKQTSIWCKLKAETTRKILDNQRKPGILVLGKRLKLTIRQIKHTRVEKSRRSRGANKAQNEAVWNAIDTALQLSLDSINTPLEPHPRFCTTLEWALSA